MASKKKVSQTSVIQQTMFDMPIVERVIEKHVSSNNKAEHVSQDLKSIGLNAVVEGKSEVFKSFSSYIINLKMNY